MTWFTCTNCSASFQVGKVLAVTVRPPSIPPYCFECGAPAYPVVNNMEETWWLTMQAHYGYTRELLSALLTEWKVDRRFHQFSQFLKELEAEIDDPS